MHQIPDSAAESSTTTGTGTFTVAGALTGHTTFTSVIPTGDTFSYSIKAVDASGNLTGESETGIGTMASSTTFTRDTVIASSNGGALVSFAAGTKHVFATINSRDVRQLGHILAALACIHLR